MSIARRVADTSARLVTKLPNEAYLQPEALPPVIRRIVQSHMDKIEENVGHLKLQNPFLNSKKRTSTENSHVVFVPAVIPRRRQKQLLDMYPAHVLPPSPLNPQQEPAPIKWSNGTIVEWQGNYLPQKTESTLYSSRNIKFKGHKAERQADQKAKDRASRLETMPKRIEEWRKATAEEKSKNKPSLPF